MTSRHHDELRSTLLDATDPEAMRKLLDLKAHVFQFPRAEETDVKNQGDHLASDSHRTTVVYDGEQAIASFMSFDTTLSLPGGESVPANAITDVVVLPTHKRRGLLRSWITADARDAVERGAACSVLYAAEPGIYGRFGFGVATAKAAWTLQCERAEFLQPATGRMRIISPERAFELLPEVDARARRTHAGSIAPGEPFWKNITQLTEGREKDRSRWFAAHENENGDVDGIVSYSFKEPWHMGRHENSVIIHQMRPATVEAERELWRHCAEIDFITEVSFAHYTPYSALQWFLKDPRAARSKPIWDGLWLRILDVPRMLTSRRYPVADRITLRVNDDAGYADGTFTLVTATDGTATCERASAQTTPDLEIGVQGLGSLLLGGGAGIPSLDIMVRREEASLPHPADLPRIAALFGWPEPPHALTDF